MIFSFERPLFLIASFVVIPIAMLIASRMKSPFVALLPLGAPGGTPFKAAITGRFVKFLKVLEIAGIFLLFFSAAGPVIKTPQTVWLDRGADIVFVLDVSPSMAAKDMDGRNRFTAAKTLIEEFAQNRPFDAIGLAAVGNDAAVLVPPTTDREVLNDRLNNLKIGEFGEGTALGMGLAVAGYHLVNSKAKRKVAILLTDGENNAGAIHPETAASMLGEMGISLWVIGIGSGGKVPIEYTDPFTNIRRTGTFDSAFDTESLRRLSAAGGGTYIAAPTSNSLSAAFSFLDDNEITIRRSRTIYKSRPSTFPYLIIALSLLLTVRFIKRVILGALV